jgi:enolase-phosphatase E1
LKALPDVLANKWNDDGFKGYRDAFPETATASPEAFEAHVNDLTKRDVKVAYLKNLQGMSWMPRFDH